MPTPSKGNSLANMAIDVPPVSHEVNPSKILAPVSISITSASDLTPSIHFASMDFAPSINGLAATIKADNSAPIAGRPLDIPLNRPPTILPKKEPRAKPIFSKTGIPLSKKVSSSGKESTNAPMPINNPPTAAINTAITPTPIIAATPNVPTRARIGNIVAIVIRSTDNAVAVSSEGETLKADINPRTTASSATTRPSKAIAPMAPNDTLLIWSNINNVAAMTVNNIPNAIAVDIDASTPSADIPPSTTARPVTIKLTISNDCIADFETPPMVSSIINDDDIAIRSVLNANADCNDASGFKEPRVYSTAPNVMMVTAITRSSSLHFFAFFVATIITANAPVTKLKAPAAACNFVVSINESATIAKAITPIADVNIISSVLHALANFVTAIKPAITPPRAATTATPFTRFLTGIKPSIIAIVPRIAIATDIINNVPARSLSCLEVPRYLMAAIRPTTTAPKAVIATTPCASSSGDIVLAIFATSTIIIIAPAILSIIPPILSIFLLPVTNLLNAMRATTIAVKVTIADTPRLNSF